ncbi:hypothetical protein [Allosphingosinicella indica]|uniref:Uncharacterized protein n=1 Tax=Allosphingosinicella indica TaxID=941907 RepID=A0A1X7GFH3_9SPHN|nr:hypothetical protein [Allosphingosinicella indica]SMF69029.1 hypothetical protein SAMN06295910_1676 [Allosphingosinicella indica]
MIRLVMLCAALAMSAQATALSETSGGKKKPSKTKLVCKMSAPALGTRLGATRKCATEQEWATWEREIAEESRRNIDKVQMQRATVCPPNC